MTGPRPDFLGIGAQRSGTTWLSEMLTRHPQVRFPMANGRPVKELHFWDRPGRRSLEWWLGQFIKTDPAVKVGEYTPAYAPLEIDIVRQIHAINPDLRLIYVLRNPIDRAWSGALHAAREEKLDTMQLPESWFLYRFGTRHSLMRGNYESCLRTWTQLFPRRQILLATYEAVVQRPRDLLALCCRHLGVDEAPMAALPDAVVSLRVNASPPARLTPAMIEVLLETYAPQIESLSRYLGQDFSPWVKAWEQTLAKARQTTGDAAAG